MKRLFYGVALSALVIGAGGAAVACDQHNHSAALMNPAAATQAAGARNVLLAQSQQDEDKSSTSSEGSKDKDEALPSRSHGMTMAQAQQDEQSDTSGSGSDEQKSGDEQKDD